MTPFPNWPALDIKRLVTVHGTNDVYLKVRETSEQLIPAPVRKDGYLSYQFYYNKASKLIGYKFSLDSLKDQHGEVFPRVKVFTSSVMASYVPSNLVDRTEKGELFAIYHDLNVRLFRHVAPDPYVTYCILMRSKLDNIG